MMYGGEPLYGVRESRIALEILLVDLVQQKKLEILL